MTSGWKSLRILSHATHSQLFHVGCPLHTHGHMHAHAHATTHPLPLPQSHPSSTHLVIGCQNALHSLEPVQHWRQHGELVVLNDDGAQLYAGRQAIRERSETVVPERKGRCVPYVHVTDSHPHPNR